MLNNSTFLAVAEKFSAAVSALDVDAVASLYTDDLVVRTNVNDDVQSKADNLAMLRAAFKIERAHGLHDVERLPTPDGFVQMHTFKPILVDGISGGKARVCMIAKVRGGKICELREFVDASQLTLFWARIGEAMKPR